MEDGVGVRRERGSTELEMSSTMWPKLDGGWEGSAAAVAADAASAAAPEGGEGTGVPSDMTEGGRRKAATSKRWTLTSETWPNRRFLRSFLSAFNGSWADENFLFVTSEYCYMGEICSWNHGKNSQT